MHTRALTESVALMSRLSSASFNRQKPTRLPYSCHAQCGRSGSWVTPVGGGSTCRGIARELSHTSALTIGQTTRRASPGSLSGGRSTIAEYWSRFSGFIIGGKEVTEGNRGRFPSVRGTARPEPSGERRLVRFGEHALHR